MYLNNSSKSLKNILVLSGAGIDSCSGLQTFRSKGGKGLWAGEDIMAICSATGFKKDPNRVYSFYNKRRKEVNGNNIKVINPINGVVS